MGDLNTILLVEDDKMVRQYMREALEKDFLILEASKGKRSLEILKQHKVNLVLLDLNLPDARGMEFVTAIRAHTSAPLIVVSGESNNSKRVQTIDMGADDFVPKPINMELLTTKIKAHIRRFKDPFLEDNSYEATGFTRPDIRYGKWKMDAEKFQFFDQNGESAGLTTREFQLMNVLINNAGRAITRKELCEAIREQNYIPSDRAIDVKITRIRKKICDNAASPELLKTVRGVGYMFNKDKINTG